jgi:hypothetical protein
MLSNRENQLDALVTLLGLEFNSKNTGIMKIHSGGDILQQGGSLNEILVNDREQSRRTAKNCRLKDYKIQGNSSSFIKKMGPKKTYQGETSDL